MKKILFSLTFIVVVLSANAQGYTETFDSNSLEWTECAYKNSIGTAIIDQGIMKITSKGKRVGLAILTGQAADIKEATYFETHCYAPIDVMKPFEIHSIVNVKKFTNENLAGMLFNYKDNGNFYCFAFNEDFVKFIRYEDGKAVGEISQGIKWSKRRNTEMKWSLYSDGNTLSFKIDDVTILNIRYMPLSYAGFGYYTFGEQELSVDEVQFIQ